LRRTHPTFGGQWRRYGRSTANSLELAYYAMQDLHGQSHVLFVYADGITVLVGSPRSLRAYLSCDAPQISVCHIRRNRGRPTCLLPCFTLGIRPQEKDSRASGYGEKIGLAHYCPNPSHRFSLASASRGHSDGTKFHSTSAAHTGTLSSVSRLITVMMYID
jgi:hypothetical protein